MSPYSSTGTNILLVAPFSRHGDGGNGSTVSVLAQTGSDLGSKTDNEGAGPVLHAHGLQLDGADPWEPQSVVLPVDIDVGGAVLVDKGELGALALGQCGTILLGSVGELGDRLRNEIGGGSRGSHYEYGWLLCCPGGVKVRSD